MSATHRDNARDAVLTNSSALVIKRAGEFQPLGEPAGQELEDRRATTAMAGLALDAEDRLRGVPYN